MSTDTGSAAPPLSFEELAEKVRKSPFHQWLGVQLVEMAADSITIEMPWREEFVSGVAQRNAHGGVLASLVDLTADFAIAARIGRGAPTIDLRVDFHRPALPGTIRATGRVIRLGRTITTAEAHLHDAEGRLVASGRAAYLLR